MGQPFNILVACTLIAVGKAADDLPLKVRGMAMELDLRLLPEFSSVPDLSGGPAPADSAIRIEAALERAKKSAASGERMFRAGIIAKIDAEKRTLKVVQLMADLAVARSETAKVALEAKRGEFAAGEISQQELDAAQSSADAASEAETAAVATRDRAELADAEINLSRQRKLLAAGVGSKSLVARAQSWLAALKNKAHPMPADPVTAQRRREF